MEIDLAKSYSRSLRDPLTWQDLRKQYEAGQYEICASFLTNVAGRSDLPFGNFGKRDLHWVIERAHIEFRGELDLHFVRSGQQGAARVRRRL